MDTEVNNFVIAFYMKCYPWFTSFLYNMAHVTITCIFFCKYERKWKRWFITTVWQAPRLFHLSLTSNCLHITQKHIPQYISKWFWLTIILNRWFNLDETYPCIRSDKMKKKIHFSNMVGRLTKKLINLWGKKPFFRFFVLYEYRSQCHTTLV